MGMRNCGFVQGKTIPNLPWDSWHRPYIDRDPEIWFLVDFRNDGSPYMVSMLTSTGTSHLRRTSSRLSSI